MNKWVKELSRPFSKEEIEMASKYMKKKFNILSNQ